MAYPIETDLLLATAIQAAINHSAFVTFSVELRRASLTPCPTIHIPLLQSPNNPTTTGYFALCSLVSSLQAGLLRAPAAYALQAEQLVFDLLPFVRSWVTYFMNHFVLPSLDSDGDLTVVSSNVLRELVDNRETTSLRIIREVASMKIPSTDRLFLPRMLCDLLFSTERIPASENRRRTQRLCCEGLSFIDKSKKAIPLAHGQVLDILRTNAKTFINLLHATVTENLVDLDNTPPKFIARRMITIYLFYEALGDFLSPHTHAFWPELVQMKHTQWICRAILAATSPRVMKLQQQDLPISQETPVPLFAAIIHLIAASLEQLSLITLRLGHPQVQIILESKVLLYLLRYCQTFSLSSNSVERQHRLLYSIELPSLLTCMAPYLVYHSVLLPAVRLHKAMQREVQGIGLAHHPEIRQAWKLYSERLVYLDRVRQSQKSRPPLCEFPGCSNSEKRLHRMACAGCGLYYYCSRPCQRADWKAHRSKCAERRKDQQTTFLGWTSTQDSWFLGCVVQDMLSTDDNKSMLGTPRYIDFTEDNSELKIRWEPSELAGDLGKMVRELQGRDGLLVAWKLPRGVNQQLDGMMRIDMKVVRREKTFILHNRDLEDRNTMLYK